MKTPIIKINPGNITEQQIDDIVQILKRGGVIAYPTETVYGLGGDATDENVVNKIEVLKERKIDKPFLVLVSDIEDVIHLVVDLTPKIQSLMKKFWPGPLTLLLKAKEMVPRTIAGREGCIGVRISSDPFCQRLVNQFKKPLVSTSANPSSRPPAGSAAEVKRYFDQKIDLIVNGGERKSQLPSTILDFSVDPPRLVRQGSINVKKIEKIIGEMSWENP